MPKLLSLVPVFFSCAFNLKNSNFPIRRARNFDANGKRVSRTTGTPSKNDAKGVAEEFEARPGRVHKRDPRG